MSERLNAPLDAIVIAGPTASGKTGLAVQAAKLTGGPVINADSMQIYDVLSVVTARPQADEMENVEHLLFGHVKPSDAYSVARYLDDVRAVLVGGRRSGKIPVFAGGTGLYFKALLEGLAPVAEIDETVRRTLRARSRSEPDALYRELQYADREASLVLKPGDQQRIVRALEVVLSTGKPLSWWQNQQQGEPLLDADNCLKIVLLPDREMLREKIKTRFAQMVALGGLEETRALLALNLPDDLPAMRAIGVRQLAGFVRGEIELDAAIELAVHATRQYAKRQSTWFRNQFLARNANAGEGNPMKEWHEMSSPPEAYEFLKSLANRFVNHEP